MNEPVYLTTGRDGGGEGSAVNGRAVESEQKRPRDRDAEGGERRSKGERRQAFTCGRHPMMHSCC